MKTSGHGGRAFVTVLAGSLALLVTTGARAGTDLQVSLDYDVEANLAGCPNAATFRAGVARQLGRDPFRENAPKRIVVRLFSSGARTEGRLEWRGANDEWEGERGFSSRKEGCAQIARAMALATAIQIQLLAGEDGASTAGPAAPPPTPTPPVTVAAPVVAPVAAPAPREPRVAVDFGAGVLQNLGDTPAIVVPGIAVWVGRPSAIGLRFAASGLGPGAEVVRSEGTARVDRFVMTAGLVRAFRTDRRVQPLVAAGVGWHALRARGVSAMPALAQGHEGWVFSALVAASGGLAFALAPRLSFIVEVEALFFWPAVTVRVGAADPARFGNTTLLGHVGLLARF